MIPGAAIYTQRRKARHHTEAMLAGFPALEVGCEAEQLEASRHLHILGGLQFGCLALLRQILDRRLDYIFWDRAYIGGGTPTDRLRVSFNAYQKRTVDANRSLARFEAFGGLLQDWRPAGRHVLIVPPSEAVGTLFCGDPEDWTQRIVAALQATTDRPLMLSRKGDARPLAERLRDCQCVVTWSSNVAVEALCAGVPAYVSNISAAAPVAAGLHEIHNGAGIENPPRPDREAWAASLAWGQFTHEEIRCGFARAVVLEGA